MDSARELGNVPYVYNTVAATSFILCTDLKINMEYISGNAFTYTQTLKTKNVK